MSNIHFFGFSILYLFLFFVTFNYFTIFNSFDVVFVSDAVFDCCFTADVLGEHEYKNYLISIMEQMQANFPEASYMVFNFNEGGKRSQASDILTECDVKVMDYPLSYEGCFLLPLEMILHFLKSSESWLTMEGQKNVLLMHCERGGWPVLAFMLAALLLYRKQYTGEQKTLEMMYKQSPVEYIYINHQPSQLRYLQYISKRDSGSDWPAINSCLILEYLSFSPVPTFIGEGVFRPVVRVHGHDPRSPSQRNSSVLFSSGKTKRYGKVSGQVILFFIKSKTFFDLSDF